MGLIPANKLRRTDADTTQINKLTNSRKALNEPPTNNLPIQTAAGTGSG
jgi:hypothetical protein